MKSTEGLYFSRLDHVRALAAYMVFVWHFAHLTTEWPYPYAGVPIFPMALLEEGHTGVSLFMALSGYLFAKIVGDRRINFWFFLWSRAVRLFPLLFLCLIAWAALRYRSSNPVTFFDLIGGFVTPRWPAGAWSITVELHFYLIFPALLAVIRLRGPYILAALLLLSISMRALWWMQEGTVQDLAYWTIVGHIDQFLFGMMFARVVLSRRVRAMLAIMGMALLAAAMQHLNICGGFYACDGYPSKSALWTILPTVEAFGYASLIAWYDKAEIEIPRLIDIALSKIGEWSYSIYLLHFFFRFALIWAISPVTYAPVSFGVALLFATTCFIVFLPIPAASYQFYEKPFLRLRRRYLSDPAVSPFSGGALRRG